jgi:cytoplasmic iron level regulating protein YaaA (DUF328/UPF0246 family)
LPGRQNGTSQNEKGQPNAKSGILAIRKRPFMIILMNSSKTLDFEQNAPISKHTIPELIADTEILVKKLNKLSMSDISSLMKVSEKLAQLNFERYANWQTHVKGSGAKQALLAFKGDIYSGIEVENYNRKEFDFAQKHLRILSGLYGILRPLDLIRPYRLEMATRLATSRGRNLYQFWGTKISESVGALLKQEKSGVLLNLCSAEYFKVIRSDRLDAKIITPVFKEFKNGSYRFITIYAKKARGLMCHYIIQNQLVDLEDLKLFNTAGYHINRKLSSNEKWVFTRGD